MPLDSDDVQLIGMLLALAPLGWLACKKIFRRAESIGYRRWPLTTAIIQRVRTDVTNFEGNRIESHAVEYSYTLAAGTFAGEFPALEPWDSHYTLLTPWDVMYPTGKQIQVHYNPSHPSISVAQIPDPEGMPKAL